MSIDPVVSVIMPFRDTAGRFLEEAVGSVSAQTERRWELMLIDDGSDGPSSDVALALEAADPQRVQYLEHDRHASLGMSASRNLGIRRSSAKYVAFLDSDDVWAPGKLEEQLALIGAHPDVGMLYGNTEYWHSWTGLDADAGRDWFPRLGVHAESVHEPPHLLTMYLRGAAAVPCTCSVLVRREVGDRVGWFEDSFRSLYEDQVFYARMVLEAPVLVSGKCWDRYRQHDGSSSAWAERHDEMAEARRVYLSWLSAYIHDRGIDDPALTRALGEQLACYEPRSFLGISEAAREIRRRTRKWRRRLFGVPS